MRQVGVAAAHPTARRSAEDVDRVAREGRQRLTARTRPARLSAPAAERRRDVRRRGEQVDGVDVVGWQIGARRGREEQLAERGAQVHGIGQVAIRDLGRIHSSMRAASHAPRSVGVCSRSDMPGRSAPLYANSRLSDPASKNQGTPSAGCNVSPDVNRDRAM